MQKVVGEELSTLRAELDIAFNSAGAQWTDAVDRIWSFGPKRSGPNLLINWVESYDRLSVWSVLDENKPDSSGVCPREVWTNDSSIIAGFQMATQAGPLCEEPMHGVCFIIEQWKDFHPKSSHSSLSNDADSKTQSESISNSTCEQLSGKTGKESKSNHKDTLGCGNSMHNMDENGSRKTGKDVFGPMSGQLMSVVKEGCRKAFQTMPQRLMVAMYHCAIQADTNILGVFVGGRVQLCVCVCVCVCVYIVFVCLHVCCNSSVCVKIRICVW